MKDVPVKIWIYKVSLFVLLCGIAQWLCPQITIGQSANRQNLVMNPDFENLYRPVEKIIARANAFRYYRGKEDYLDLGEFTVFATPLNWKKFCVFNGIGFCSNIEGLARSGECYMQLRISWGPNRNTISNGAIAASLHHSLEPGCDYKLGIWVAKSEEDPGRLNNATLTVQGLRGKTKALNFTPEDSFYLQFNIPIHEMEVGDYRYYEGVFTALSEDTHLLVQSNSDEFVFGRKARRIHRRCKKMRGGCHPVKLASITFDDISLVDISGCNEEVLKEPIANPEIVEEAAEFITFSPLSSNWIQEDTTTFYFKHDNPFLSAEELERLRQFLKDLDGQIVGIHAYTDSTGSDSYNKALSSSRTQHILNELNDSNTNSQPEVAGLGACKLESCTSMEQCRRVEVIWKTNQNVSTNENQFH